jgi:hypothetical protein
MGADTVDVLLLAVAAVAFASLAAQVPGVLGFDGIEPVESMLRKLGGYGEESFDVWGIASTVPTLLWWSPNVGLPADVAVEILLLAGFLVCCIGISIGASPLIYVLAWAAYLSVYVVGGTMLSFQWDSLLMEVLVGAALHAPLVPAVFRACSGTRSTLEVAPSGHSLSARWLLRGTLFKLMFMAGAVKILSNGPTWLSLSALNVHFQGQCLPHALSWWVAQLPQLFLKAGVAATLVVEGPVTLLLLVPFRPVRMVACWLQALFQVLIILTGSYNFFNLLTLALILVSAADDFAPAYERKNQDKPDEGFWAALMRALRAWAQLGRSWFGLVIGIAVNFAVVAASVRYGFELETVSDAGSLPWWQAYSLSLSSLVTPKSVQQAIIWTVPRASATVLAMICISAALQLGDVVAMRTASDSAVAGIATPPTEAMTKPRSPKQGLSPTPQVSPSKSARKRAMRRKGKAPDDEAQGNGAGMEAPTTPAPLKAMPETKTRSNPEQVTTPEAPTLHSASARQTGWVAIRVLWLLFVGACCVCIHAASTFAVALNIGGASGKNLVPVSPKLAQTMAQRLHNWHVTSVYGLFRQMTGVGPQAQDKLTMQPVQLGARPEIVVEATRDRGATWQTVHFVYKPTDLDSAPPLAFPHQPRLDWQMWFAALGTYDRNPWLISFVDKLLEGSPAVMRLLDLDRWPFVATEGDEPESTEIALTHGNATLLRPQAVRCRLVHMDFTRVSAGDLARVLPPSAAKHAIVNASLWPFAGPSGRAWWYLTKDPQNFRQSVTEGREYLMPLVRGHEGLATALQQAQLPRITAEQRAAGMQARAACEFGLGGSALAKWACVASREARRFWTAEAVALTLAVLVATRLMQ